MGRLVKKKPAAPYMATPSPFDAATGKHAPIIADKYEWPRHIQVYVISEYDDYLVCNPYTEDDLAAINSADETALGSHPEPFNGLAIAVAKPFLLQRTPFDGEQVTFGEFQTYYSQITVQYEYLDVGVRKATDVSGVREDEIHVITPPYFSGEIIQIGRSRYASGDWTGLTRNDSRDSGADDSAILWADRSSHNRAWAVYRE